MNELSSAVLSAVETSPKAGDAITLRIADGSNGELEKKIDYSQDLNTGNIRKTEILVWILKAIQNPDIFAPFKHPPFSIQIPIKTVNE